MKKHLVSHLRLSVTKGVDVVDISCIPIICTHHTYNSIPYTHHSVSPTSCLHSTIPISIPYTHILYYPVPILFRHTLHPIPHAPYLTHIPHSHWYEFSVTSLPPPPCPLSPSPSLPRLPFPSPSPSSSNPLSLKFGVIRVSDMQTHFFDLL